MWPINPIQRGLQTESIPLRWIFFLSRQSSRHCVFRLRKERGSPHPLWGRLALAACLVLAFFVFIRLPSHETLQPVAKLVSADEWDWMNARPTDNEEATVGYLLDTSDLSSDDILGDLASLVQELDM